MAIDSNKDNTTNNRQSSVIEAAVGYSVDGDDMHWTVSCPQCNKQYEYEGFFDSSDKTKCKCGCTFKTSKVWVDDSHYIE